MRPHLVASYDKRPFLGRFTFCARSILQIFIQAWLSYSTLPFRAYALDISFKIRSLSKVVDAIGSYTKKKVENIKMRPASRLMHACRITLFTRSNCSLCTSAKDILSTVWDTRPFAFKEVDVMKPDQVGWRNLYEFDTPVVGLFT